MSKKSDPHEHANIKWKECRIDESDLQKKAHDHVWVIVISNVWYLGKRKIEMNIC